MIYAITLLALLLSGSIHTIFDRPEAKPNFELSTIKSALRTISDFLRTDGLGYQAVSKENEKLIRSIQHELDMDDFCIEIRRMTNSAQRIMGRTNAFVIPSLFFSNKSHAFLYISEDWFNSMPMEEKQALIRHELMHLKHDHVRKKLLFSISAIATYHTSKFALKKYVDSHATLPLSLTKEQATTLGGIISIIYFTTFFGLSSKLSRIMEKEADIEAAKTMAKKDGFIELFNDIKYNIEDPESKFKIKRVISNMITFITSPIHKLLATHPELDDRIDYIKNMA